MQFSANMTANAVYDNMNTQNKSLNVTKRQILKLFNIDNNQQLKLVERTDKTPVCTLDTVFNKCYNQGVLGHT